MRGRGGRGRERRLKFRDDFGVVTSNNEKKKGVKGRKRKKVE